MRYLLDTHTFLWFVTNDPKLSVYARETADDPANALLLSIASIWEIAIKVGNGRLPIPQPLDVFIPDQLRRNRIDLLPIQPEHAVRVATLPQHHRDPFDRLLIAQALLDDLPLIGRDPMFDAYGIRRIW